MQVILKINALLYVQIRRKSDCKNTNLKQNSGCVKVHTFDMIPYSHRLMDGTSL